MAQNGEKRPKMAKNCDKNGKKRRKNVDKMKTKWR